VVAERLEGLEHFAKVGGGRHGWLVGLCGVLVVLVALVVLNGVSSAEC
jgi:hypothetical protein